MLKATFASNVCFVPRKAGVTKEDKAKLETLGCTVIEYDADVSQPPHFEQMKTALVSVEEATTP